jgi:hypothetical protein
MPEYLMPNGPQYNGMSDDKSVLAIWMRSDNTFDGTHY